MDQTSRSKPNLKQPLINQPFRQQIYKTRYNNKSSQLTQSIAKLYATRDQPSHKMSTDNTLMNDQEETSQHRMSNDKFRALGRDLRQISEQFKELYSKKCLTNNNAYYTRRRKWQIAFTTCLVLWGLMIAQPNSMLMR